MVSGGPETHPLKRSWLARHGRRRCLARSLGLPWRGDGRAHGPSAAVRGRWAAAAIGATTAAGAGGRTASRKATLSPVRRNGAPGMRSASNAAIRRSAGAQRAGINGYLQRWLARDINARPDADGAVAAAGAEEGIPLLRQSSRPAEPWRHAAHADATPGQRQRNAAVLLGSLEGLRDRANDLIDGISTMDSGRLAGTNLRDMARIALEMAKNDGSLARRTRTRLFVNVGPALNTCMMPRRLSKGATAAALEEDSQAVSSILPRAASTPACWSTTTANWRWTSLINGFDSDVNRDFQNGAKVEVPPAALVGLKEKAHR